MKGKMIALLTATLCVGTMFTACGGDDKVCTSAHIDGNKDHLCDNCNSAVVLITEKLPAEEELKVDMIVNALPTEDKNADYINTTMEGINAIKGEVKEQKYVSKSREIVDEPVVEETKTTSEYETITVQSLNAFIKRVVITKETIVEDTADDKNNSHVFNVDYILYDELNDKELVKKSVSFKDSTNWAPTRYIFDVYGDDMYKVTTANVTLKEDAKKYNDVKEINVTEVLYDMEGNALETNVHKPIKNYTVNYPSNINPSINGYLNNGEIAWLVNGTTYVFDNETNKVIYKTAKDELLFDRPEFDAVIGDKGYVYASSRLYVYNLKSTEWVDCIYTYDMPSFFSDVKVFYLNNGNVLIQSKVNSNSTVNYDIVESETKKNLVYTMIDLSGATPSVKEVEFGYYIQQMMITDKDMVPQVKEDLNLAIINPIVDSKIDTNKSIIVAVDKDLNIVWDYDKTILGQTDGEPELVADGLFKVTVKYDNSTSRKAVIDTEGNFVNWIPMNAIEENGFLKIDGSLYNYKLELVIDKEKFDMVDMGDYYLLAEEVLEEKDEESEEDPELLGYNVYYFSRDVKAPVKVIDYTKNVIELVENEDGKRTEVEYSLSKYEANYFTIKYTKKVWKEGVLSKEDSSETYTFYNAAGEKLYTFDKDVDYVNYINEDCVAIVLEDGEGTYLVRNKAE